MYLKFLFHPSLGLLAGSHWQLWDVGDGWKTGALHASTSYQFVTKRISTKGINSSMNLEGAESTLGEVWYGGNSFSSRRSGISQPVTLIYLALWEQATTPWGSNITVSLSNYDKMQVFQIYPLLSCCLVVLLRQFQKCFVLLF